MTDEPDLALSEVPSPFAAHVGLSLASWRRDYARVEVPLAAHIANRHGIPHGGVHGAMLDTAMGYAGCYTGDLDQRQFCVTLNLNVNYIGRPVGQLLIAEGWRTGGGRKTFFGEGALRDESGLMIASATGVFRYISGG